MGLADVLMFVIVQATAHAAPWAQGAEWQAISKWWNSAESRRWSDHLRHVLCDWPVP